MIANEQHVVIPDPEFITLILVCVLFQLQGVNYIRQM